MIPGGVRNETQQSKYHVFQPNVRPISEVAFVLHAAEHHRI